MFKEDDKNLAKYYLEHYMFPFPDNKTKRHINKDCLELIIRPECDQKCEYCYIYKYGEDLYPERIKKNEILKNIDLILNYLYNNRRNFFYEIELFGGDLFSDKIFFDIIDIIEKYYKQIKTEEPELLKNKSLIMIPNSLTFVNKYPEIIDDIIEKVNYLEKNYNLEISFSWSTDGFFGTKTREKKELNEEYFDNCFNFLSKVSGGIHPMISAENVEFAKQNYDWWLKKYKQFEITGDFQPMMLEVRNGKSWTEEKIQYYLDFLTYLMEIRFNMCNNSIESLATHLFDIGKEWCDQNEVFYLKTNRNYDPLIMHLSKNKDKKRERMTCALQGTIHFNCTNLSIAPCHRLTYPLFTSYYFKTNTENTEIIDFDINNLSAAITTKNAKAYLFPKCCVCEISPVCLKGCLGAQFEDNSNILFPIESVCNFFKKKTSHLINLYNQYGIIDFLKENNLLQQEFKDFFDNYKGEK